VVALRAGDVEAFIARPDLRRPVILVYGPDQGLVHERIQSLLKSANTGEGDPFALVPLEGDTIASDPGRLADEVHTIGLFGGRRLVHVRAGSRSFNEALEALLDNPPENSIVLIEAGDLKRGAPLRKLLEPAKAATVIPCYQDSERDLSRLIDKTVSEAGLSIDVDARDSLIGLIGADRLASRSELEKLTLYAKDKKRISFEDVQAVIADASSLALDDILDSAAAGDADSAVSAYAKALKAGIAPDRVINAAIWHVFNLHRLSLQVERGQSVSRVVEGEKPQIHFKRKPKFERALSRFNPASLEKMLTELGTATLTIRRTPDLAESIAERAILALAKSGRKR
jgi:DNA polymerase III subunit delta